MCATNNVTDAGPNSDDGYRDAYGKSDVLLARVTIEPNPCGSNALPSLVGMYPLPEVNA